MPIPPSLSVLGILLFLLPGFISAIVLRQIATRAKQSDFERLIEALVLSFILYLTSIPFFGNTLPVSWHEEAGSFKVHLQWLQLLLLFAEAVLFSLMYGVALQHDWLHKVLRKCKITEKTSRISVWNDVLQDVARVYLLVEIKDGRRLLGYLTYYSDDVDQSSLFLEDAAWLTEEGQQVAVEGPGVLLTKEAGITTVTFLNPK